MGGAVTGKLISARTKKIYIKDGVMHIYLTSAVVKNELMMLRESLRQPDKHKSRRGSGQGDCDPLIRQHCNHA